MASRKFLLCSISLFAGLAAGAYALLYKPEQFATVCTFVVSVLGVYGGANVTESYLGGRYGYARSAVSTPAAPADVKEQVSGD
jgi:hypothetical protein